MRLLTWTIILLLAACQTVKKAPRTSDSKFLKGSQKRISAKAKGSALENPAQVVALAGSCRVLDLNRKMSLCLEYSEIRTTEAIWKTQLESLEAQCQQDSEVNVNTLWQAGTACLEAGASWACIGGSDAEKIGRSLKIVFGGIGATEAQSEKTCQAHKAQLVPAINNEESRLGGGVTAIDVNTLLSALGRGTSFITLATEIKGEPKQVEGLENQFHAFFQGGQQVLLASIKPELPMCEVIWNEPSGNPLPRDQVYTIASGAEEWPKSHIYFSLTSGGLLHIDTVGLQCHIPNITYSALRVRDVMSIVGHSLSIDR